MSEPPAGFFSKRKSRVVKGMAWEGALTRHGEVLGLVVWVPVRDGFGQVVNGHLILLARFYHKVAEGKMPLKRGRKGRLDRSHKHLSPSGVCPENCTPTRPLKGL